MQAASSKQQAASSNIELLAVLLQLQRDIPATMSDRYWETVKGSLPSQCTALFTINAAFH
jgi:hypothetical protein